VGSLGYSRDGVGRRGEAVPVEGADGDCGQDVAADCG
jgi:hypothetical protein